MKQHLGKAPFSQFDFGKNVRLDESYALEELANDIEERGLDTPLELWQREAGVFEVLKGHRRMRALQIIKDRNPKRFVELFGKEEMVPAILITDITPAEAILRIVDHGQERRLTSPHELQMCANLLFEAGRTEEQVANQLSGIMDQISPMKPTSRRELDELIAKREAARKEGNSVGVGIAENEIRKYVLQYRRGLVQNIHNAYRCPDVVMAALYLKAAGKKPEGVTVDLPDKITYGQVNKLHEAFRNDLKILKEGIPQYDKVNPGPNFNEAWKALLQKSQEAASTEGEPREKAMSAKEMLAQLSEGKWRSKGFKMLTSQHAGKPVDAQSLSEMDQRYNALDYLFERGTPEQKKDFEAITKVLIETAVNAEKERQVQEAKAAVTPPPAEKPSSKGKKGQK